MPPIFDPAVYVGTVAASKIYLGSSVVWQSSPGVSPPPDPPFAGDIVGFSGSNPYIVARRINNSGSVLQTYSNPGTLTVSCDSGAFAPDGSAIFAGVRTSPYIRAWSWSSGTGFGTQYSDPATALPTTSTNKIAVSKDSSVIFCQSGSQPILNAYAWDSTTGFGAKYADPSTPLTSGITDLDVHPSGKAVVCSGSGGFIAYAFDKATGFGARYSIPFSGISLYGCRWNWEGDVFFGSSASTGDVLYAYPWDNTTGFGTKYTAPTVASPFTARDRALTVSPDSSVVVVGKSSSPQFRAWPFDKTTGWGAELSSLTVAGNGISCSIAPTGDILAVYTTGIGGGFRLFNFSSSGFGSSLTTLSGTSATITTIDFLYTG